MLIFTIRTAALFVALTFISAPLVLAGGTGWKAVVVDIERKGKTTAVLNLQLVESEKAAPFQHCSALTVEVRYGFGWLWRVKDEPNRDAHAKALDSVADLSESGDEIEFAIMGGEPPKLLSESGCHILVRRLDYHAEVGFVVSTYYRY